MKKVFLFAFIGFAFAACDGGDKKDAYVQQCGDYSVEINMSDDGEKINAVINGDTASLTRTISASGAKYDGAVNDTAVTLWEKGEIWTLILDDDMVIECVVK